MWSHRLKKYLSSISRIAIAVLASMTLLQPVSAAEKIKFQYGIGGQSVSLEELETFAETGETSPALDFLFQFSNRSPALIRLLLVQEIALDAATTSRLLNSPVGELVLDSASNVVNSGSSKGNREALRGALIASASDDGTISLLEVWRNYPTREVVVDGESWIAMTEGFSRTLRQAAQASNIPLALLQIWFAR